MHERDLEELFGKFGRVVDVRIMMDHRTRHSKGYGFVRYKVRAWVGRLVVFCCLCCGRSTRWFD